MKFLNAQQLAFILDIKKDDARAMMCNAWCKYKSIENKAERTLTGKVTDPYPIVMTIDVLSDGLNLPTLQSMVDDIVNNYLIRPATKKWILCDYPEKLIKKAEEAGKKPQIKLPPALASMLPKETLKTIEEEWKFRYVQFSPEKEEHQTVIPANSKQP